MILKDSTWPARQKCRNGTSVAGRLYGRRLHFSVFAMLVLAVLPQTALTQSRGETSPFLPLHHWSYASLAHLQGAGLLNEGFDPGATTLQSLRSLRPARIRCRHRGRASTWVGRPRRGLSGSV